MAASDARIFPLKNTAYRVTFPILDADGDLVTGATGLDSEVSQDGGTFADCTNEATEIATSSGMYYLDLTSGEMNGDTVALIVKTSSSGAKTTAMVFYPVETGDIDVDVTAFGGTAATTSGGRPEVNTTHAAGTAWGSGAITAASIASDAITAAKIATGAIDADALAADCITAAKVADGTIDANTFAAGAITASAIAADAIGASELAADAVAEIADAVWDEAAAGHVAAGSFGEQCGTDIDAILTDTGTTLDGRIPAALVGGRMDSNVGAISADATAADNLEAALDGTGGVTISAAIAGNITGNLSGTVSSVTGSVGGVAAGGITASSLAADCITASKIANGAIDAATFAADVDAEILSYIVDDATQIDASSLNTATVTTIPAIAADHPNRITKNTALSAFMFKMVDATDGYTAETGVTVTATRSLDGAAFASCANSATEVASGWYKIDLATTDLNANTVVLRFTGTGCRTTECKIVTQPT